MFVGGGGVVNRALTSAGRGPDNLQSVPYQRNDACGPIRVCASRCCNERWLNFRDYTVRSRYKRQLIRLNMNKKWPTRSGMEDSRP